MNYKEKLSQIAGLVEALYEKYPSYIHFDFVLSTNMDGNIPAKTVRYNIYTPEIGHNQYADFDKFIAFIELLLSDGVESVAAKMLKKNLENQIVRKANAEEQIKTIQEKLKRLTTGSKP